MFDPANLPTTPRHEDLSLSAEEALKTEILRSIGYALLGEAEPLGKNHFPDAVNSLDFHSEVRRFEIHLIEQALIRTGGRIRAAARLLRMKAPTLQYKIRTYDISVNSFSQVLNHDQIIEVIDAGVNLWRRK